MVAIGLVFGEISLLVTNGLILRGTYERTYRIRLIFAVRYLVVLVVEVFKAGISAIALTVSGRLDPGIVEIHTDGQDPLRGVLIANAITLTPGTVTVDYDRGKLTVIWINCTTSDPELAGEIIKGSFERALGSPSPTRGATSGARE